MWKFKNVAILSVILACALASPKARAGIPSGPAVGTQYDTAHVYVTPADFNKFVASLIAIFGGTMTKQGVFTVTPTPSKTMSQLVLTHAGSVSVFGFETPIPYPFGSERSGYLVQNLDAAVSEARADGAAVIVSSFPDPIGRDAIIQWPGGVNMQLYWHTRAPNYPPLLTVPENRVYVSAEKVAEFVRDFTRFSHGTVVSDDHQAPGIGIGQPDGTYHCIHIVSPFGRMAVLVTNGQLPYPYGRDTTGYEVADLTATLAKAKAAGVALLLGPYETAGRQAAIVQFPGGYIAEIHTNTK